MTAVVAAVSGGSTAARPRAAGCVAGNRGDDAGRASQKGDNAVNYDHHYVEPRGVTRRVADGEAGLREWIIAGLTPTECTREVEADMDDGGAWVPSVPAHGEIEEDVLYFVDTQDVWDMRSGARMPFKGRTPVYELGMTWLFPPDLVV
uniref:Uncharacterized protein n=1 Tax=Oryza punctata TaxID=4537 RepID=A0A0E0LKZ2_ORYPU